jgi:hypothetical protein
MVGNEQEVADLMTRIVKLRGGRIYSLTNGVLARKLIRCRFLRPLSAVWVEQDDSFCFDFTKGDLQKCMAQSILPDSEGNGTNPRRFHVAGMPVSAIAFLVLSATIVLIRTHYQLLGIDEYGFGLLGIARNSGFARLVHIQLTRPVSFDPIGYNALIYGVIRHFGTGALVMRLPSIAGYLLMQMCLFFFVRRIANERAATVALALPSLMGWWASASRRDRTR